MDNNTELHALTRQIGKHAIELYNLMKAGSTIIITLHDEGGIVVPGQPSQVKYLIITKPDVCGNVHIKPAANTN